MREFSSSCVCSKTGSQVFAFIIANSPIEPTLTVPDQVPVFTVALVKLSPVPKAAGRKAAWYILHARVNFSVYLP